jgi:hypothetical protein
MLPKTIQLGQVGSIFYATLFDKQCALLMNESSTTGLSSTQEVAVLKALSEFVERKAYQDIKANHSKQDLCGTDGYAAFPVSILPRFLAVRRARENALSEAFERFVWSKWWDDQDVGADITKIDKILDDGCADLLSRIFALTKNHTILEIRPKVSNQLERQLIILLCKTVEGGYISGGAAGLKKHQDMTYFRALGELYCHALALNRYRQSKLNDVKSSYEKRLLYFALGGKGTELVDLRLAKSGNKVINLPNLIIDCEISHVLAEKWVVYRCLFENQSHFLGGSIERLCL